MGTIRVSDKIYAMDARLSLLVASAADRSLRVYDVRRSNSPLYEKQSRLKHQLRCLSTFPNMQGYVVGGIEGRVSVDHIQESDHKRDFMFKCHRKGDLIYPVNSITFHQEGNIYATAGSDGGVNFWDKGNKFCIKQFARVNQPISARRFFS